VRSARPGVPCLGPSASSVSRRPVLERLAPAHVVLVVPTAAARSLRSSSARLGAVPPSTIRLRASTRRRPPPRSADAEPKSSWQPPRVGASQLTGVRLLSRLLLRRLSLIQRKSSPHQGAHPESASSRASSSARRSNVVSRARRRESSTSTPSAPSPSTHIAVVRVRGRRRAPNHGVKLARQSAPPAKVCSEAAPEGERDVRGRRTYGVKLARQSAPPAKVCSEAAPGVSATSAAAEPTA